MRRLTLDALNAPFERDRESERRCQHPGCPEDGEYRAPISRERLREYYWFCLEHVREYNQAWDYFAGMSEQEIERQRRWDTVWHRPSWPFGRFGQNAGFGEGYRVHDGFDFFFGDEPHARQPPPQTEEQKALKALDLSEPVSFDDVKSRYKTLVKQLHPDANPGDPASEERLKVVNQAYAALKISFA